MVVNSFQQFSRNPQPSYRLEGDQTFQECIENIYADFGVYNLPDSCFIIRQIALYLNDQGKVARNGAYGAVFSAKEAGQSIIIKLMKTDGLDDRVQQDAVLAEAYYQMAYHLYFSACENLIPALGIHTVYSLMDFDRCFTKGAESKIPPPAEQRIGFIAFKTPQFPCTLSDIMAYFIEQHPGERLPLNAIRVIVDGLLNALECLHANNVMHRDLKPENIGISAKGFAILFDFGFALFDMKNAPLFQGVGSRNWCPHAMFKDGIYRKIAANEETYGPEADNYGVGMIIAALVKRVLEIYYVIHPTEIENVRDDLRRDFSSGRTKGNPNALALNDLADVFECLVGVSAKKRTAAEIRTMAFFTRGNKRAEWQKSGRKTLADFVVAIDRRPSNQLLEKHNDYQAWTASLPQSFRSPRPQEILASYSKTLNIDLAIEDFLLLRRLALQPSTFFKDSAATLGLIQLDLIGEMRKTERDSDKGTVHRDQIRNKLQRLSASGRLGQWAEKSRPKVAQRRRVRLGRARDKRQKKERKAKALNQAAKPTVLQRVGEEIMVYLKSPCADGDAQFYFEKLPTIYQSVAEKLGLSVACFDDVSRMCRDGRMQLPRLLLEEEEGVASEEEDEEYFTAPEAD